MTDGGTRPWLSKWPNFLQDGRRRGARRLVLAGYSRGGSAAMMAAQILNKQGLRVDAMLLFDPVARHASEGRGIVPGICRSAVDRKTPAGSRACSKVDHTTGPLWHSMFHNPMRAFLGRPLFVMRLLSRQGSRPSQDRTVQSAELAAST